MGALALLTAQRAGAKQILVTDVSDERLATARAMGAAAAVNTKTPEGVAEAKQIAGFGYDLVIDASGSGAARQMAFDLCRPGGCVTLLGMAAQKSEVDFVTSIRKEHRVVMSFAYNPVDFQRALDLLIAGEIDLSKWTERLPLERGQEAMDKITHKPGALLKMLLEVGS